MAQNDMLNTSKSPCYMIDGATISIFILDRFSLQNMGELIGHLGNAINKMAIMPTYNIKANITSPYDLASTKNPVIDIFIDSNGGDTHVLSSISTLLNIAKQRGAIIRTTVLSNAFSCGSLLAIQGTPGFRIMSHNARHLVHFGSIGMSVTKQQDLDIMPHILTEHKQAVHNTYLANTNITKKKLNELMKNESGYLTADECMALGMCDWIIGEHGKLIGRTR